MSRPSRKLIEAGVKGELADLAELHMAILKESGVKEMATYERRRYLFMTTDPVHVGTGGYRPGRVDLSIVREPGTRVPGSRHQPAPAARAYSARIYESLARAGQGTNQEGRSGHCGRDDCPICYTFGYLSRKTDQEDSTVGYSGVVNVFDARVLLFPVYSMAGLVWG